MDIGKEITEAAPSTYEFLCKWKELSENGEPPYDIHIPGYGTFTNCKVIPETAGYTIEYDNYEVEE